jgi:hypothetical protein
MDGGCVTFQYGKKARLLVFDDVEIPPEGISKDAFMFKRRYSDKLLTVHSGDLMYLAGFAGITTGVKGWESPPAPKCGNKALFVLDMKRAGGR